MYPIYSYIIIIDIITLQTDCSVHCLMLDIIIIMYRKNVIFSDTLVYFMMRRWSRLIVKSPSLVGSPNNLGSCSSPHVYQTAVLIFCHLLKMQCCTLIFISIIKNAANSYPTSPIKAHNMVDLNFICK